MNPNIRLGYCCFVCAGLIDSSLVRDDARALDKKVVLKGRDKGKGRQSFCYFWDCNVWQFQCSRLVLHHFLPSLGGIAPMWTKSEHSSGWTKHISPWPKNQTNCMIDILTAGFEEKHGHSPFSN